MTELKPSFVRTVFKVGLTIILVSIVGYFMQGYQEGRWWSIGYIESLSLPLTIMILIFWFAFVPRRLAYSQDKIIVSTILGTYAYARSDVERYGGGIGVYTIKFRQDRQQYQIYSGAYSSKEWATFLEYLNGS